ncbi:MAG: hypothetical protein PHS99_02305 [Candidatus Marinimicrobia bacterium]|nr:hypothetical protein [Candidatus Neomarinimicrobiota bacterium]
MFPRAGSNIDIHTNPLLACHVQKTDTHAIKANLRIRVPWTIVNKYQAASDDNKSLKR